MSSQLSLSNLEKRNCEVSVDASFDFGNMLTSSMDCGSRFTNHFGYGGSEANLPITSPHESAIRKSWGNPVTCP